MSLEYVISELQILLDVVIASILAGIVGIEREIGQKPAGFRTHMIIGGASALLISMGQVLVLHFKQLPEVAQLIQTDPIRIIEAIIVGISFIGAGTILKSQSDQRVRYLTTAASVLFAAGIGMSVALHHYVLAVGVTIIILLVNYTANLIDRMLSKRK